MDRPQGHPGCRFSDRLCCDGPTGLTRLNHGLLISLPDQLKELIELASGQEVKVSQKAVIARVIFLLTATHDWLKDEFFDLFSDFVHKGL